MTDKIKNSIKQDEPTFEMDADIKDLLIRMGSHSGYSKFINMLYNDLFNLFMTVNGDNLDKQLVDARSKAEMIKFLDGLVNNTIKENE